MAQMTKEELDALIEKSVEAKVQEKVKAAEAEQKSALRAEFQEAYEAAHQEAEHKGYKEEPAIIKMAKLVNLYGQSGGDIGKMQFLSKKMYDGDKEVSGYIGKALEAGVPSAGGFGIPQVLSARVIDALYAQSILDKCGVAKIPMPNGNLRMARMDTSTSVGWVGELPSAAPTQPVFGDVNLSAKKLFAISEISNSLIRYNSVGIESWLARDLQKKFRLELDRAAFYGSGTSHTPAGLTNLGVQTSGSSTTALTQLIPDELLALLKAANIPMTNVHWGMSPQMEAWLKNLKTTTGAWIFRQEMIEQGRLAGHPYHVSTQISYTDTGTDYGDLWVGDWDEFLWGAGLDLELRMSQEASFVSGGTTYSAFQRDSALVRVVGEHDFNVMHPAAFVHGTYSVS
jgi:HK97 family phage major capsid protein